MFPKCKGRLVLRRDVVKADSECWTSSPDHQDAQKKQGTAASAYTPSRNGGRGKNYYNFRNRNAQHCGFVDLHPVGQNLWDKIQDPVVPLERNLYRHTSAGLLCERLFQKVLMEYGWDNAPRWECCFIEKPKLIHFPGRVLELQFLFPGNTIEIIPARKVHRRRYSTRNSIGRACR